MFDQFVLDTESQRLVDSGGRTVALRPQAFRVLAYLIEHAPAVVSRKELLAGVWGHEALSASGISQAIREIRRGLSDSAAQPRIIGTRHGCGYQIVTRVVCAESSEGIPIPGRTVGSSRRMAAGVIVAVLLTGLAAGTYWSGPQTIASVPLAGQAQPPARAADGAQLPSDPEARGSFLAGQRYLEAMQWKQAIENFRRAMARAPDSSTTVLNLIKAHLHAGFDARASDLLNHPALQHSSLSRRQQLELRALIARTSGDWDEVIHCLRSLAEFFPENLEYRFELFDVLLAYRPPGQAAKELRHIEAVLGNEKSDIRFMLALHALEQRMHQPADALAAARLALDAANASKRDALRARAELAVGRSLARIEDWPASREALRRAENAMRAAHDDAGHTEVLNELARHDLREHRLAKAREKTSRACAIAESIGYRAGIADCSANRAAIEIHSGRHDVAESLLADAVLRFERAARMQSAGQANLQLARLALKSRQWPKTEQRLALAARTYDQIGDRAGFAWTRHLTGNLLQCKGRISQARAAHAEARTIFESIDLRRGTMASLIAMARLQADEGHHARAMSLFDQAAALDQPLELYATAAISSTLHTHDNSSPSHTAGNSLPPVCPDMPG